MTIEQSIAAIEERVIAFEARVSYLASSLARLEMLLSHPEPTGGLRIGSALRAAINPDLNVDINRIAAAINQVTKTAPPDDLAPADLNAEAPAGSTVLISGQVCQEKAGPDYGLKSLCAQIYPIAPKLICDSHCQCVEKVTIAEYGDVCAKAVVSCPFNKAHK